MADELAVVEVVRTEAEAELLCSLLRTARIRCLQRLSDRGAGVGSGGYAAGPREVVVQARDLGGARKVLASQTGAAGG
jgi:Putative prokaryotic signal transducing protein